MGDLKAYGIFLLVLFVPLFVFAAATDAFNAIFHCEPNVGTVQFVDADGTIP